MKQSLQYHENQLQQIARNIEYLGKAGLSEDAVAAMCDYHDLKTSIDRAKKKGLDEFDVEEMLNVR